MASPPKFKLYHCPATRCARVRWLLYELLDEAFEIERVPLYGGAQYRPGYLEKDRNHECRRGRCVHECGSRLRRAAGPAQA